jgi:hypothetical protein
VPHDPLELLHVPVFVHTGHGVHGLNPSQFHALLRPEQPPVHAHQFNVPHDLLELLHVPVLVHVVHEGHGVHGLHPNQPHAV